MLKSTTLPQNIQDMPEKNAGAMARRHTCQLLRLQHCMPPTQSSDELSSSSSSFAFRLHSLATRRRETKDWRTVGLFFPPLSPKQP